MRLATHLAVTRSSRPARSLLLVLVVSAALVGVASPSWAATSTPHGWSQLDVDEASAFHVAYVAQPDGSVLVTQDVTWVFPQDNTRRGYEWLETTRHDWQDDPTKYRVTDVSDVTATSSTGAPANVSVIDGFSHTRIRIGDPKQTVTGTQKYRVSYRISHVVNDIGDGTAELYLNLFDGENSTATFNKVSSTVTGPADPKEVDCYSGEPGTTDPCQQHTLSAGKASFQFGQVAPQSAATVVVSFPREAFGDLSPLLEDRFSAGADPPPPPTNAWADPIPVKAALLLAPSLIATLVMGLVVWFRGRDKASSSGAPGLMPVANAAVTAFDDRARTTVVQFTPPAGVPPGLVGVVLDERADTIDVSATVVDLAVRGYLTIAPVTDELSGGGWGNREDWLLVRQQPPAGAQPLEPYEERLYDRLFWRGPQSRLSSLRRSFAGALQSTKNDMITEVTERGWVRGIAQRGRWLKNPAVWIIGSIVAMFWFIGGPLLGAATDTLGWSVPLVIGIPLMIVPIALLSRRLPYRTASGSALYAQILGFKEYLETAEADQISWEEAQDVFSRYLPYAIVFGVADRWARTFDDVASAAQARGHAISSPSWYAENAGWTFTRLGDRIDDFATVAKGTFAAAPAASARSGGSARGFASSGMRRGSSSSGRSGGSAGGGIGGGGGGSW